MPGLARDSRRRRRDTEVWAPARLFFLLKKHDSAVRFPGRRQAVVFLILSHPKTFALGGRSFSGRNY